MPPFDVFVVGEGAVDDAHLHLCHVADDGGHGELRQVGRTGLKHGGHLWNGDDLLDAVGSFHFGHVEAAKREVNDDLLLTARNQSHLGTSRGALAEAGPFLGVCHY